MVFSLTSNIKGVLSIFFFKSLSQHRGGKTLCLGSKPFWFIHTRIIYPAAPTAHSFGFFTGKMFRKESKVYRRR